MQEKNKILAYIKDIQKAIWWNNIQKSFTSLFFIFSILFLFFMLMLHFKTVNMVLEKVVFLSAIILVVFLISLFLKRPSLKDAALYSNEFGFKDRLNTYLEYKDTGHFLLGSLTEEIIAFLEAIERPKFRKKMDYIKVLSSVFLICLAVGIYYIPSYNQELAWQKKEINKEILEEREDLKDIQEALKEDLEDEEISLDERENKKIALKELEKLERNLKKQYKFEDGALEVNKAQENILEKMNKNIFTDNALKDIFEGIDESKNSDLLEALSKKDLNKTISELEKKRFGAEDQEKINKNIENLLKKKGPDKEKLEKIDNYLEKDKSLQKLAEDLKKEQKKKKLEDLSETESQLESMKERLLAKTEDGFKGLEGKDKNEQFALGDNENTAEGEESQENSEELASGSQANKKMDNPSGQGGSDNFSGSEQRDSDFGEILKEEQKEKNIDSSKSSELKGKWSSDGEFLDREIDNVISLKGEDSVLKKAYLKEKKNSNSYANKFEIPLEEEALVSKYFEELYGGD